MGISRGEYEGSDEAGSEAERRWAALGRVGRWKASGGRIVGGSGEVDGEGYESMLDVSSSSS